MIKKTMIERSPHIVVALNGGVEFIGSLKDLEAEYFQCSVTSDENDLIDFLYDWAYDEGFDIEIVSRFQEDFWDDVLFNASIEILEQLFQTRQEPLFSQVPENQKILELIKTELKSRKS